MTDASARNATPPEETNCIIQEESLQSCMVYLLAGVVLVLSKSTDITYNLFHHSHHDHNNAPISIMPVGRWVGHRVILSCFVHACGEEVEYVVRTDTLLKMCVKMLFTGTK